MIGNPKTYINVSALHRSASFASTPCFGKLSVTAPFLAVCASKICLANWSRVHRRRILCWAFRSHQFGAEESLAAPFAVLAVAAHGRLFVSSEFTDLLAPETCFRESATEVSILGAEHPLDTSLYVI
jgi:hypothetical protein